MRFVFRKAYDLDAGQKEAVAKVCEILAAEDGHRALADKGRAR